MDEHQFRCRRCKEVRLKRRPDQQYCGREACQKARKNAWRRLKYQTDPDYRANQRESTDAWLASQGGGAEYYRRYRKQRQKLAVHRGEITGRDTPVAPEQAPKSMIPASANSDARTPQSEVISGRYEMLPCGSANSDAILVDLFVIPTG